MHGIFLMLLLVLFLILWSPGMDAETSKRMACLSNVKSLGFAAEMYRSDFDDRYWPNGQPITLVASYWKPHSLPLNCPSTHVAYRFNSALNGATAYNVKEPERTVEFYEGIEAGLAFVHQGKATVSFVDGHRRLIPSNLPVILGKK